MRLSMPSDTSRTRILLYPGRPLTGSLLILSRRSNENNWNFCVIFRCGYLLRNQSTRIGLLLPLNQRIIVQVNHVCLLIRLVSSKAPSFLFKVLLLISLSLSLSTIIELDWSYLLFIYFMEIISEQNKRQSEECRQLKALLEDLESMFFYYLLELLRKLSSFTLSVSLFSLLLMVPANFYFILVHRNLVLGCKMRTQTTL